MQNIKRSKPSVFLHASFFILILLIFFDSHAWASAEKLWEYCPQAGFVDTSPGVGDLDEDGVKDLVFCTVAGRVLALNSLGLRMWYYDAKETITTPPVVSDIDNDGTLNILIYTNNGKIICLNGADGNFIWQYQMPSKISWGGTSLLASDLQNDGEKEIIASDNSGDLICLNAKGMVKWHKKIKDKFNSAPAAGYLSVKDKKNILIGSDRSPLICFNSSGKELWRVSGEQSSSSSPLICDLNGDGINEILVGAGKYFVVFDSHGKKLWQYKMRGDIHDGISFGDLDGDNKKEIVVEDLAGDLVVLNAAGSFLWKDNLTQRVRRSAAIGDVDGDYKPEILAAGYSSALFVFKNDGSVLEKIPLKGGMNATPTIVDFKNDGKLSVVCGSGSGIAVFNWSGKGHGSASTAIPFAEYRCNSSRTGSIIKQKGLKKITRMDVDYGGRYVGDNIFKVTVHNPHKKSLTLQLAVKKDGAVNEKIVTAADTLFQGELFYNIDGRQALNFEFTAKLSEKDKTLQRKSYGCYIIPFAKDLYDLKETLTSIKTLISGKEKPNKYVKERLIVFAQRLDDIEERSTVAATMPMLKLTKLKNDLSDLRSEITLFDKMVRESEKAKNGFAAYSANPWAPFGGVQEVAEGRLKKAEVSVEAFNNEVESAAINLANYSGVPLNIRVEALLLTNTEDSTVVLPKDVYEFHEVLSVPTQMLDYSADALPLMNQAFTMLLPNYDLRQLWININTKTLSPGLWKGVIKLRSVNVESRGIEVPVSIRVWEEALPEKQPVNLCHWGYVNTSRLKDYPQEAYWDQLEHGTNVFVATNYYAPQAKFDDNGNIIGKIDFSRHDDYVKKHAENSIILFFNYQQSLKGPAEQLTPVWNTAYKEWIGKWIEHLKSLGVTYEHYAFYPIDEPGLHNGLVERFVSLSKLIREVDPNAQIYTDPVGRASLSDLKKMSPYVDIWCPNRNGYLLNEGQDKLAFIKSTGKTVWTYECIGNAKHLSPLGYYRAQAWLIWHYGLSGMGFWSYCTSSADPWYVPQGTLDYLLIYQGQGVVSSKRWEAIRDGVEDYGILSVLRSAVDKGKGKAPAAAIKKAQTILNKEAFEIGRYCGLDDYGTEPGIGGLKEMRNVEDARWNKIKQVRREIAGVLEELKQGN